MTRPDRALRDTSHPDSRGPDASVDKVTGVLLAGRGQSAQHFYPEINSEFFSLFAVFAEHAGSLLDNMTSYEIIQQQIEALKQANRAKTEFLANISHEIRTPLNSVINIPAALLRDFCETEGVVCGECGGFFQLDEGESVTDESACPVDHQRDTLTIQRHMGYAGNAKTAVRCLRTVQHSGQYLLAIVGDLLDMSKIEAGRMSLEPEWVVLNEILEQVAALCAKLAAKRNSEIRVMFGEETKKQFVDRVRISQLLVNLVSNALRHGGDVKHVALEYQESGENFAFTVRDHGLVPGVGSGRRIEPGLRSHCAA